MSKAEILIVGAGPVGLSASLALAKATELLASYNVERLIIQRGFCRDWARHENG